MIILRHTVRRFGEVEICDRSPEPPSIIPPATDRWLGLIFQIASDTAPGNSDHSPAPCALESAQRGAGEPLTAAEFAYHALVHRVLSSFAERGSIYE